MYDFMFSDYRGDELWQHDAARRRQASARGLIFSADELAAILALWAGVGEGRPVHGIDRLRLPLVGGGHVEITPNRISIPHEDASAEALKATMLHIAAHWQGRAVFTPDDDMSRQERLRVRAYAEVYGIEIHDVDEAFRPTAFTATDLAMLPALRREIREAHPNAPPARPDEAKQLAAIYARRYPFRRPVAA